MREAWHILEPGKPYVHGWVIDAICAHLEAITTGRFLRMGLVNRLLINVPPGLAKSLLVSIFWPAWEWGPAGLGHLRYFTTSYKEEISTRDSRKMRDLVMSQWYQSLWGDKVHLIRSGESSFENAVHGNREAMAFTGLTGGRGDRVVIDDPHSTEEAESETDRKKAIRIFRESVPSRVNDQQDSAIVIIMQRLHEEDVSGIAIKMGLGYIHLRLPMEFEEKYRCSTPIFTDPRTYEGELLFPERFPRPALATLKKTLGSYGTASQLQQTPSPREGLMFKRAAFRIVDVLPAGFWKWVRGWDLAGTASSTSPYTAGIKLGRNLSTGQFAIANVARTRVESANLLGFIQNVVSQDGPMIEQSIPQDPGQAGKFQAVDFIRQLAGYPVFTSPESGDKIARARPVQTQVDAGNVMILRDTAPEIRATNPDLPSWNEDFLLEAEKFPAGAFKDQIDALSRALMHLTMTPGMDGVALPIIVTAPREALFGDHPEAIGS